MPVARAMRYSRAMRLFIAAGRFIAASLALCLAACGAAQSSSEEPAAEAPEEPEASSDPTASPSADDAAGPGGALTAEECEANGGMVVGDIGDGAIHRPDYRCPSGSEPSGDIVAPAGGPVAIEGSVCCPK
jgi:hypothetical protein